MDKTLDFYNQNADEFINGTIIADLSDLHSDFLSRLPVNASILDLGCGAGRDSKLFMDKGFRVTALDGAEELCKKASIYIGQEVICEKFEDMTFDDEFQGIWACASLLHVKSTELPNIIRIIAKALKSNGYFYASFKYGDFEGERNGRYFTDMNEARIEALFSKFDDLRIVDVSVTADVRIGRENEKWLNVLVSKC